MSALDTVPAHTDDNDLMVAASLLTPAERAARIPAVREAARLSAVVVNRLGLELTNAPVAQRERIARTADTFIRRVAGLNAWEAALVTAQDLDEL